MDNLDYESVRSMLEQYSSEPTDAKSRKRLRIVQAATDLFVRHGYRRASMDEVARNAGVAKGTVYLYFKAKADLLMAAIAEEKKGYLVRMAPILKPGLDPLVRLRSMLSLGFSAAGDMPLLSRLLSGDREILMALEELDPGERDQVNNMRHGFYLDLIREACGDQRSEEAQLEEKLNVVVGLLFASGAFFDPRIRSGMSLERFADVLASMLVHGVAEPVTGRQIE